MTTVLERLRRPEYTGDDRCWPCTIANGFLVTIAAGLSAAVGRRRLAAVIAAVGGVSIALRGYVVPYTPRFAPQFAAALPIDAFDHGRERSGSLSDAEAALSGSEPQPELESEPPLEGADDSGSPSEPETALEDAETALDGVDETDAPSGDAVVTALLEAGVVVPEGDELRLDPVFREDWRAEMRTLRDRELEGLAAAADELTDPSVAVRTSRSWGRPVLVLDGPGSGLVALRRGVAVAELAAGRALEPTVEDDAVRRAAGRPLRTLLERCPLCDGALTIARASCCGEVTPVGETPTEKLFCPDCDERFFTYE